jgi:predicted outer membrane repeat protein
MPQTKTPPLTRRSVGLAGGILLGLSLALAVLGSASASAPAAPAVGLIFRVNNALDDGLVGYWKFDQVSGTATINSAPLAFLTTLSNGASITTDVAPVVRIPDFGALHLDGVNHLAQVADDPALDVAPGSFSVAAWVRRATVNNYDAIYDSGTETNKWWVFIADGSAGKVNRFGFGVRGLSEVYSTRSITDTNWHHLAVVKNGNGAANLAFYVDGVASGVVTVTNVLTPTGSKRIGALLDGSLLAFFGGDIDELRLYQRALSATEVLRLAVGRGCVTDGASWPTALTDLQCGIDLAGGGDEIWVAKSPILYRPGTSSIASFRLVNPVGLFGGFAGTETARGQRPPIDFSQSLSTTLSGDLFADDSGLANRSDNSFNVVAAQIAAPAAALDGFVIRAGNSNNPAVNSSLRNGGGLNITATSPALSNLLFITNNADNRGGGLFSTNGLTMTNVNFVNNTADFGGGAEVEQDAFVDGGRFEDNRATTFSGGGLNVNGTLVLTGTTFVNNHAAFSGGGAAALTATVTNARFERNQTNTFSGGGLSVNSTLALVDSVFLSNTSGSSGNGGGAQAHTALVSGGLFQNNRSNNGSALLGGGGGLIADAAILTGTQLISNSAKLDGGGLSVGAFSPGSALLSGVVFLSNTARNGGGLALVGALTSTNSVFDRNAVSVSVGLGGAAMVSGTLVMDGGHLEGNLAASGGALSQFGTTAISNSVFLANRSIIGNGGAIAISNGGTRLTNILFVGNQAGGQGGAIQVDSSGLSLSQITAVSNTANVSGSVLFANSSGTQFANSIVWHNGSVAVAGQGSGISFVFNLGDAGLAGTGNVAANPIFVRNPNPGDGDWTTLANNDYGDLHLRLNSPGIDAANNTLVPSGLTRDLAGRPRFVDIPSVPDTGVGSAPIVDMGAYEAELLRLFLPVVEK